MNPGDTVRDASRPELSEASGPEATVGVQGGQPTRSPGAHKPLQDIQDIIDKLAAVTQQLRQSAGHRG